MKTETDLIILDNLYFQKSIIENKLRLNEIYFKNGIFDQKDFKKNESKLNTKLLAIQITSWELRKIA